MKRFFAVALVLALAVCLVACGSPATTTAPATSQAPTTSAATTSQAPAATVPETPEPSTVPGGEAALSASYADIMKSGTYYMDYVLVIGDTSLATKQAVQGQNSATEMEVGGTVTKTVLKDGKLYSLNDADKTVVVTDAIEGGASAGYDDLTFIGTGEADSMAYEEYTFTSVNDGGENVTNTLRYFFTGETLTQITINSGDEIAVMAVNEITGDIPAGSFDIPDDYTVTQA